MGAVDSSASIHAKVERADEHVRNLASEIRAFWNIPNRYAIAPQRDPKTGDEVFYLDGNGRSSTTSLEHHRRRYCS